MAVKPGWEGRFYEDFEIGDVYRCRLGRTVTENDKLMSVRMDSTSVGITSYCRIRSSPAILFIQNPRS